MAFPRFPKYFILQGFISEASEGLLVIYKCGMMLKTRCISVCFAAIQRSVLWLKIKIFSALLSSVLERTQLGQYHLKKCGDTGPLELPRHPLTISGVGKNGENMGGERGRRHRLLHLIFYLYILCRGVWVRIRNRGVPA